MTMKLDLTQDQMEQLNQISTATGRGTDELVREAIDNLLSHDEWFREQVQTGLDQAERGEFLTGEDVRARLDRVFRP